jgi:hypothetical protein
MAATSACLPAPWRNADLPRKLGFKCDGPHLLGWRCGLVRAIGQVAWGQPRLHRDSLRIFQEIAFVQMYFFCYHKTGSALCAAVAKRIAARLGWDADYLLGLVRSVDPSKQIVTFAHSLVDFNLSSHPHKGVRLIRDPRDVWLSGYLYHRRCREGWCINEEFDVRPPILFPRVPYSQQHRPEEWKQRYIAGLGGMSYQKNLLARDEDAGLSFEMERYAEWTISAMTSWKPDSDTIDVKIEDFMEDFGETLTRILRHFGMREADIPAALAVAAAEDINRMSDSQLAGNPHIHSRSISKWRAMLKPEQLRKFEARFGDAIEQLGYAAA